MQPGLAARVIVPAVNRFFQDVGIVPAETDHFLMQPITNMRHEILMTAIPELVTMCEVTLHAHAGCFDDVFVHGFGVQGRQVAMPVDGLAVVGGTHNQTVSERGGDRYLGPRSLRQ